jgi:5'(3')-deoxyribonucleotidase
MQSRIFFDMDGVLADFSRAANELAPGAPHPEENPDLFAKMQPVDGAIAAVNELKNYYDLYILSAVPWRNPAGASQKIAWIKRYFGDGLDNPFFKKIILTHNKDLVGDAGDWLIDDRPTHNGADRFRGQLIAFGSAEFPDWPAVTRYLVSLAKSRAD